MARTVEEVIAAARELTEAEQRVVVEELSARVLHKEDVAGELHRRSALWNAGEVTDVDSDELFAELRARRQ
jgi:hypothetical protein